MELTFTGSVCAGVAFRGNKPAGLDNRRNDYVFLMDLGSMAAQHRRWERERSYLPAEIDQRAKQWRDALADRPIGDPPKGRDWSGRIR
jgi:hypothetical protein